MDSPGKAPSKDGLQGFFLLLVQGRAELLVLFNELVGDVGVDTLELQVGVGLLELAHDVGGERAVHHEHRVAPVRGFLHVAVLALCVGRVGRMTLPCLSFWVSPTTAINSSCVWHLPVVSL